MKRGLFFFILAYFVSTSTFADSCYVGKYIVGISGNLGWEGRTGIFVSDTVNGKPNPAYAIPFAEKDTSATAKVLYSIAQNAANLHQKINNMECNNNGHIVSFSVVRTND